MNTEKSGAEVNKGGISAGEALLRTVIDALDDAVSLMDRDLNILLVNRRFLEWCEQLGLERDPVGKTLGEVYPFISESALEQYKRIFETGRPEKELEEITLAGQTIVTETRKIPLAEKGAVQSVLTIVRDISEHKQAELTIRASEERFHQLFNTIGTCVAVYKPIAGGEDFAFLDINPAGEKHSKVRRDEIVGRPVTEVFPAVHDFGLLDVFKRVHRTGKTESLPLRQYQDGRIEEWVENTVYRLPNGQIIAVYDDTSEQHRAEERLRAREETCRALADNSADTIMRFDRRHRHLYVNPKVEKETGIPPEAVIGKTHQEMGFP